MIILLTFSLAVIRLRRTEPQLPRPWKMPLFPLPALVSVALNVILLALFLVSDWKTGICLALLLAWGGAALSGWQGALAKVF